jgi:hypothetical protein
MVLGSLGMQLTPGTIRCAVNAESRSIPKCTRSREALTAMDMH